MDINKKINDIILRYQLDQYYPGFRKKLLGEAVLIKWMESMPKERVLCVGADREDINYFSHLFYNCKKRYSYYLYSKKTERSEEEFDYILVISKKAGSEMLHWCARSKRTIIFLYDYLELHGICCEDELYKIIDIDYDGMLENSFPAKRGWREIILMEFYMQKTKLALAENEQYRRHYAQKLFFLSLYIRNFIQAEKYQKMLEEAGEQSSGNAWKEVQALLTDIRHRLHSRKSADIVMLWMDAVSYGTGQDMPFLQKQVDGGVNYENAFTVTPRTNPTAQTLFSGEKLIDDSLYLKKEITEENSVVIQDLLNHGYVCKVISGYLVIFERKLRSENYHELYTPCSVVFWDMLYNLLNSESPVFLLAHALTEGHAPHLTTDMEEKDFCSWSSRLHKGHLELDRQMEFYMDFLGKEVVKIFMSDHGQPQVKEQFHTYFIVKGKNYQRRAAKELFSYVDFHKLLHEILEGNKLDHPIFDREYAEVQMLDFYNNRIIGDIIRKKRTLSLSGFGYFGIVTKDHLYLNYHIGNEYLARWNHMEFEPHLRYKANNICDDSLVPYFREILGNKRVNINENEKFRYTRYLYKLYKNYLKKREKVFNQVNGFFQGYSEQSIVLRMGGAHSAELFGILTTENKKKLLCIADANENCRCLSLGLSIVPVESIKEDSRVQAVVLSSFDHLEELRKEADNYPTSIDIIDIYKNLEEHGIHCDNNFYAVDYMIDEDYDVGFPFEELEN